MGTELAYAMGAPGGGGSQGSQIMSFLPIIFIFVIFYFLAHSTPAEARKGASKSVVEPEGRRSSLNQWRDLRQDYRHQR